MVCVSTVASYAISNGMEYLLPPLDPYGHDDAELYESFFEHKPYSVAMQAANVIQLQCTNKYKTLHHLEHSFPNDTQPWWPIGGVDEFTKVTFLFRESCQRRQITGCEWSSQH